MNTFSLNGLLILGALWPLCLVCLLGFKATRPIGLQLAPWAALPALAASLVIMPNQVQLSLPMIFFGSEIGLDATGRIFLLLTALLWGVSGIYARAYLMQSVRRTEFFIFFLLSMTGNFGLIVAQDLFGFYFGFTLMSFAAYGLVVFERTPEALRAGRVYMALTVAGELMLFVALLMTFEITGAITFDAMRTGIALMDPASRNLIVLLGLAGFGIKAGMFGLHMWLPLAHPIAPAPASAVLSGAMIKAGLLGWLQLLPLGEIVLPEWGTIIIIFGAIAAFYGVVIGLMQHEPKTLLAYSSISQMGVMTMALGLGLLAPHAWQFILPTIAFYALHHGLSKGALFLGVGFAGDNERKQQYWLWLALWFPALALAGAPWTSGMLAKQFVKAGAMYAPMPWDTLLPLLLSVSALATSLLMARLLYLVRPAAGRSVQAPAAGLVYPWAVLLIGGLLVPWWCVSFIAVPEIQTMPIVDSLWPVVVTVAIVWVVLRLDLFQTIEPFPAQDILLFMTRGSRLLNYLVNILIRFKDAWDSWQREFTAYLSDLEMAVKEKLQIMENYFARWEVAILFVVIVALGMGFIPSR